MTDSQEELYLYFMSLKENDAYPSKLMPFVNEDVLFS